MSRRNFAGWVGLLLLALWGATPWLMAEGSAVPVLALPKQRLVALTFDDGPRRSTTTALLDGLQERGAQATFFLIGTQVPEKEDLLLRMEAEGHQVAIHSYDHTKLQDLSAADIHHQVESTRTVLANVLGHSDFLLRPPYGLIDDAVIRYGGCPIILWSVDPKDWENQNAAAVTQAVLSTVQDGDIILMHDIFPTSVEAALAIVDCLHAQGYLCVTVDTLFAARQRTLETGQVYNNARP